MIKEYRWSGTVVGCLLLGVLVGACGPDEEKRRGPSRDRIIEEQKGGSDLPNPAPTVRCQNSSEECAKLEAELKGLRQELDRAAELRNAGEIRRISMELNFKTELLDTLGQGLMHDSADYKSIVTKHENLKRLLATNDSLRPYTSREALTVKQVYDAFGPL